MIKFQMKVLKMLFLGVVVFSLFSCSSRADRADRAEKGTGNSCDPSATESIEEVSKLGKVIFYLENSGSMFGYVSGFSEYVNVISELSEKPIFAEEHTFREFNFINGGKKVKLTPLGNDPKVLKDKLNIKGFRCGDVSKSNLNEMFLLALKDAKEDTISILISDGIYDLQQPQSPMNALATEGKETRSRFIERLSEGGLQTLMIKMSSHFKGKYYNAQQQAIALDQDRPYYIWVFGNSDLLNLYFPDKYIQSLTGYRQMERFTKFEGDTISYALVSENTQGRFRFDRTSTNTLIDVERDRHNKGFQFTIAVDLSKSPCSATYLQDTSNYICPNSNYKVNEISVVKKKIHRLKFTPTHLISVQTRQSPFGEVEVCLKNQVPQWIETTNSMDESNIKGDPNRTFGFKFLTEGISDAYAHINKNTPFAKFKIIIKK